MLRSALPLARARIVGCADEKKQTNHPQSKVAFVNTSTPHHLNTTPSQHLTTQNSPSPDRRFLDTFLKAMEKHMSNTNLKIEDLGDEVGLSRVQLYRKVKALTGMTPVEILRETRLKRAMQLLKTTDKTVSEIANEVGFATRATSPHVSKSSMTSIRQTSERR